MSELIPRSDSPTAKKRIKRYERVAEELVHGTQSIEELGTIVEELEDAIGSKRSKIVRIEAQIARTQVALSRSRIDHHRARLELNEIRDAAASLTRIKVKNSEQVLAVCDFVASRNWNGKLVIAPEADGGDREVACRELKGVARNNGFRGVVKLDT